MRLVCFLYGCPGFILRFSDLNLYGMCLFFLLLQSHRKLDIDIRTKALVIARAFFIYIGVYLLFTFTFNMFF